MVHNFDIIELFLAGQVRTGQERSEQVGTGRDTVGQVKKDRSQGRTCKERSRQYALGTLCPEVTMPHITHKC